MLDIKSHINSCSASTLHLFYWAKGGGGSAAVFLVAFAVGGGEGGWVLASVVKTMPSNISLFQDKLERQKRISNTTLKVVL